MIISGGAELCKAQELIKTYEGERKEEEVVVVREGAICCYEDMEIGGNQWPFPIDMSAVDSVDTCEGASDYWETAKLVHLRVKGFELIADPREV